MLRVLQRCLANSPGTWRKWIMTLINESNTWDIVLLTTFVHQGFKISHEWIPKFPQICHHFKQRHNEGPPAWTKMRTTSSNVWQADVNLSLSGGKYRFNLGFLGHHCYKRVWYIDTSITKSLQTLGFLPRKLFYPPPSMQQWHRRTYLRLIKVLGLLKMTP